MKARLFPKQDDASYLLPKDVVARIAESIPNVLIDWDRGNEKVEKKLHELIGMNAPEVILTSHKSNFDQCAYVEVQFPQFANVHASFFVQRYTDIVLESSDLEAVDFLRYTAAQLSSALDYDFRIVEE